MPGNAGSGIVYGMITLDGQDYIERHQVFVLDVLVSTQFQVLTNQRLTLPGVANFLLKGLTRDFSNLAFGPDSEQNFVRFRLVNFEGTTWFTTGGLGIIDDRVFDPLCFGTGQFPFPLIPPIPIHSTGSLIFEVEDLGARPTQFYPYTLHLGFHGTYLFPPEDVSTKGPLAFPGVKTNGIVRSR